MNIKQLAGTVLVSFLSILFIIKIYAKHKKNDATPVTQTVEQPEADTEIYIINGDHETSGWFDGPSKSEFLKALMIQPQHLFITPSLWKSFCTHRTKQLKNLQKEKIHSSLDNLEISKGKVYNKQNRKKIFNQDDPDFFNISLLLIFNEQEWEFYDTHAGFYYLRPKTDLEDIGLKLETFTRIEHPCDMQIKLSKGLRIQKFIDLFDVSTWNRIHTDGRKKIVCISGHGTARDQRTSRACGIPIEDFTDLLFFFNDTLKINTLGVQSCFWPVARILELAATRGKKHFSFQLVTPIDIEDVVYFVSEMPPVWSYDAKTGNTEVEDVSPGEPLLIALHDIATDFKGTMTKELTETLEDTQVVKINHKYKMKTSVLDAGSTQPIYV